MNKTAVAISLICSVASIVSTIWFMKMLSSQVITLSESRGNQLSKMYRILNADDSDSNVFHGFKSSFLPVDDDDWIMGEAEKKSLIRIKRNNGNLENEDKVIKRETSKDEKNAVRTFRAKQMISYMDVSADPCVDFYQYACGNWPSVHEIPDGKNGFDTFDLLRSKVYLSLKSLLETPENETNDDYQINDILTKENIEKSPVPKRRKRQGNENYETESNDVEKNIGKSHKTDNAITSAEAVTKVKQFYKSCMDQESIGNQSSTQLLNLLEELGGWPVLDKDWNKRDFDWVILLAMLRSYNFNVILSQWVGPDFVDASENIIQIDQCKLGLQNKDFYQKDENKGILDLYKKYLVSIATLLGGEPEHVMKCADDFIDFETKLAKIYLSPEEQNHDTGLFHRVTVGELLNRIDVINWKMYLEIVMDKTVELSETLILLSFLYFQKLSDLIQITDKRTLVNYILWRFVDNRVGYLDEKFVTLKQEFQNTLSNNPIQVPRWETCVTMANTHMGYALGYMFVNKYFDEYSKNDTAVMTTLIEDSFRNHIDQADWIDDETKFKAKKKIDAIKMSIGYPDFLTDKNKLDDMYRNVSIYGDKYFENVHNIMVNLNRLEQSRLGNPVDRSSWNTAPAIVNAYYTRNRNQILVPAGILQPPFYHRYLPEAMNYGGIGTVIGHEITHGFDNKGRLFNDAGNLQQWWSENSIRTFREKSSCLKNQFKKYKDKSYVAMDENITQDENVADNGGIKHAFAAYIKWVRINGSDDESLPGIEMTNEQLFFVNFAQIWCGAMKTGRGSKQKNSVHSPNPLRVNVTLSNSKGFAKAFNCVLGMPMNPRRKCDIW